MTKRFLLLLSISLTLGTGINANPIHHLDKLGMGEMKYLFWTLYQAELYTLNKQSPLINKSDMALKLIYQKSISSKALIDATKDQWQALDYSDKHINLWLEKLNSILPSVNKQDSLILLLDHQGNSQFFFNLEPIGNIEEPGFGPAFMAIWLSENTSEPKLRLQLLGIAE